MAAPNNNTNAHSKPKANANTNKKGKKGKKGQTNEPGHGRKSKRAKKARDAIMGNQFAPIYGPPHVSNAAQPQNFNNTPSPNDEVQPYKSVSQTGMPALDLLFNNNIPFQLHKNADAVVNQLIKEIKKRVNAHSFVTHGRTEDFERLAFDFDSNHIGSFKHRLLKCINSNANGEDKHQATYEALEAELYYLVCWNFDAFPELTQQKDGFDEQFPALFPGCYISMLEVLNADGVDLRKIGVEKPQYSASTIFRTVLKRVQMNAPDSNLLRADSMQLDSAPEDGLTLAFTPDNFETELIRAISGVDTKGDKEYDDAWNAIDVLLYKLALKEPKAFPEVFRAL